MGDSGRAPARPVRASGTVGQEYGIAQRGVEFDFPEEVWACHRIGFEGRGLRDRQSPIEIVPKPSVFCGISNLHFTHSAPS
jgi:hypothetical protein